MRFEADGARSLQIALARAGKARQRVHLLRSILGETVDPTGKAWLSEWVCECERAAYGRQLELEVMLKKAEKGD
jgi:hypothetical protein